MSMVAKELSARAVANIKGAGMHPVGGVPGLYLNISAGGSRAWVLRVTVNGKRREMGLGGYPTVALAEAREMAREARRIAQSGIDPVEQRKQERQQRLTDAAHLRTFKKCAEDYIEAHSPTWRNVKHRAQWGSTFEAYAYPIIGNMNVADVGTPHVLDVLRPTWTTKTATATRLRGRIEQVLAAAAVAGYRSTDNPAAWRGHLDHLLPRPSKFAKTEHHPAMPIDDTPAFMRELAGRPGIAARALEFLILTAVRSGDVRAATWEQIDYGTATWTIPVTKVGSMHRVPLSTQAVAILRDLPVFPDSPYVFTAPRGGMLSDMSVAAVMRRMGVEYVPHGFRSTFRDWCGDRTTFPRDLAELALAHTLESKTEAAYRRGDALDRRREMMQVWADFVTNKINEPEQTHITNITTKNEV